MRRRKSNFANLSVAFCWPTLQIEPLLCLLERHSPVTVVSLLAESCVPYCVTVPEQGGWLLTGTEQSCARFGLSMGKGSNLPAIKSQKFFGYTKSSLDVHVAHMHCAVAVTAGYISISTASTGCNLLDAHTTTCHAYPGKSNNCQAVWYG
jgi:hypothetical protein